MNLKDVWIIEHKSKVLPNCSVVMDGSEYLYSTCYVPTDSIEEALVLAKKDLMNHGLDFIGPSQCTRYRIALLTNPPPNYHTHKDNSETALKEKAIIHDTFVSQEIMEDEGKAW
ncbi:hypothetical protein [Marinibactrum halimedae]|uniref:Uncharacterized protein n=1 Tax=Marinibactrum halimedae TaxID=1444977 RepID=A0AA37T621_9GAMM|nr:hypothetical protein [Marinibactrum halimedae]MCD9457475.1 hypothetical protein [Marinibactrum halimedae]GLS25472.1 hypothetical protein GCM10007877_11860 [Marinibactrum halimedae]